ncbi:serine/threonine-protein kinase [Nocardia sp. NPDC059177]|uniref:serine/threonine-protein kinase n=1 Tax=Nocardia sp. NPDC059177 TaxID=3346759 RepID=UPI00367A1D4B
MVQLGTGASFAGYAVDGVLGQGGMGTVYLVQHPRLPMQVALKLLVPSASVDQEARLRFEQEAQVIAQLEHPNIVDIYDTGTDDGHLWIAMQYVRGGDAGQLAMPTVDPARVLTVLGQVADALDYAHSRGVLHRDVKPANILLAGSEAGRAERAVLTDFGIARLAAGDAGLTVAGSFAATIAYAAPEQLSGNTVDHRVDQYSLACTLVMLLTGALPFDYTNAGQVIAAHLTKPPPRVSEVRTDLPVALDDVVARAMAKVPEQRYSSCGEFIAAARTALAAQPDPRRFAATMVAQQGGAAGQPGAMSGSPGGGQHLGPAHQGAWAPHTPGPPYPAVGGAPRRRGGRVWITVTAVLAVVAGIAVAGIAFGTDAIANLDTKAWGTRNQAVADLFPELVSQREYGSGWRDLDCIAKIPTSAPGNVPSEIFFDNGIGCEDKAGDHHVFVLDFDTPQRAKAYLDALAESSNAHVSWSEPHQDSTAPLSIIYSTSSYGGELYSGFPDDPARARYVVVFNKSIPGVTGESVRDDMWREAPLGGS